MSYIPKTSSFCSIILIFYLGYINVHLACFGLRHPAYTVPIKLEEIFYRCTSSNKTT
jgi:hypothetical protein